MIHKNWQELIKPTQLDVRPGNDPALARWGWIFHRHSTPAHVANSRELLRDLSLESRRLFGELEAEESFGLAQRGLLMLCNTRKGLDEEDGWQLIR